MKTSGIATAIPDVLLGSSAAVLTLVRQVRLKRAMGMTGIAAVALANHQEVSGAVACPAAAGQPEVHEVLAPGATLWFGAVRLPGACLGISGDDSEVCVPTILHRLYSLSPGTIP